MLDSNWPDAHGNEGDEHGGICDTSHGGNLDCWGVQDNCPGYFRELWNQGEAWLEQRLQEEPADESEGPNWRILLTHFPLTAWADDKFKELHEKYGFHLVFTGHTHQQLFFDNLNEQIDINHIISGGGGGITSEGPPSLDGSDLMYGFVDFKINAEELIVEFFSWGGENGDHQDPLISKKILQSEPKKRAVDTGRVPPKATLI